MRARNIKPAFFKNEELASLPADIRLLFIGLWCLADRAGRLEDRPLRVKAEILPYLNDAALVQEGCELLAKHGFIQRYSKNRNRYIQIVNFDKHQHPHVREVSSTIPAPDKHRARTGPARLIPDSLLLIPDTSLPHSRHAGVFDFETLWNNYPRKLGKEEALRHFKAQVKTPADFQDIQKALNNFVAQIRKDETEEQFIPYGSTWFNHRWKEYVTGGTHGTNGRKVARDYSALARAAAEAAGLRNKESAGNAVPNSAGNHEGVSSEPVRGNAGGSSAPRQSVQGLGPKDSLEKKPNRVESA